MSTLRCLAPAGAVVGVVQVDLGDGTASIDGNNDDPDAPGTTGTQLLDNLLEFGFPPPVLAVSQISVMIRFWF